MPKPKVKNKNVQLLESALINVPMAIGYLKPVVLLPLGALNGVPTQQMEAILAHELAHIQRRDYLMNMIQSLLEVIFFYHPVVWWLSRNIRIERENICDDIAITITGNTMEFAKALTNIQEINLSAPGLAAGLSGKNKNRLVNRIRRLAGKPKLHSGFAEGFIAASILVISLIGLSAAAMITYPVEKPIDPVLNFEQTSFEMPGFYYFTEAITKPDTTEKKKEDPEKIKESKIEVNDDESRKLSQEEQKRVQELEEAIESELEELNEQLEAMELELELEVEMEHMEAMEAYEEAMQEVFENKEAYMDQMHEAMEAYNEAMEENQMSIQGSGSWSLPHLYHSDNYKFFSDDSSNWTYEFPDNYFLHCDSIKGFYSDEWIDQYAEFADDEFILDQERELMIMEEKLQDLEHHFIQVPDVPHQYYIQHENQFFPAEYGISNRAQRIIEKELYEDGLIDHGREYMIVIGKKQMVINGEKQSRADFKKYRRLVDSMEDPWQFGDEDEFKIFIGH